MPRQPRIEYEGAVYHVLNRGNYQEDLFDVDGSGPMFEEVLFAAAGRFGWILPAYVIMSNHYQLDPTSVGLRYAWLPIRVMGQSCWRKEN